MMVAAQRGPGCCRLSLVDSQRTWPVQCLPHGPGLSMCPRHCSSSFLVYVFSCQTGLADGGSLSQKPECLLAWKLSNSHWLLPSPNDLRTEPGQEEWRLLWPHCSSGTTPSPRCPPVLARAGQVGRNSGKKGSLCGFNLSGARNKNMANQDLHICCLG